MTPISSRVMKEIKSLTLNTVSGMKHNNLIVRLSERTREDNPAGNVIAVSFYHFSFVKVIQMKGLL